MTMIVTIMEKHRVHMVSDGAGIMPDGTYGGRVVKLFPLPHLNLVVGYRGSAASGLAIGVGLCGAGGTYDEVKANAPIVFRQLQTLPLFSQPSEAFVAGFTDAGEPDAWMIANHRNVEGGDPVQPFEVVDLGRVTAFPAFEPTRWGLMKDLEGPRPLDFLAELVMDIRRTPAPFAKAPGVHGIPSTVGVYTVGAFVQIVTVERDHITTACLHRWPEDEVGKPIDPGPREMAA